MSRTAIVASSAIGVQAKSTGDSDDHRIIMRAPYMSGKNPNKYPLSAASPITHGRRLPLGDREMASARSPRGSGAQIATKRTW
jgi:hypothetical protein